MSELLILSGIVLAGIGIALAIVGRGRSLVAAVRRDKSGREVVIGPEPPALRAWRPMVIVGVAAAALGLLTTFMVVVPAGFVGVVTNFGRVEERTLPAGLQIVTPIAEQVVTVDVRVQPHTFQEIDAASREYQAVKLTGTMNYHIDPAFAYDLYRNVGLDFAGKVIDPAFNDFIKEVVPRYAIGEILQKREEIRRLAREGLGQNLARYHIIVDDIYLSNIRFSPEYENAIEQKQVAQQQVETERQIIAQKQIQAEQRVAEAQGQANAAVVAAKGEAQSNVERAKGDATATVERANGQAQANKTLAESLSDPILLYTYIQKLTDKLQVVVIPGGQNFLFDLKSLLGQTKTAQ